MRVLTTQQKNAFKAAHVKRAMLLYLDLIAAPVRLTNAWHDLVVAGETYIGRGTMLEYVAPKEDGSLEAQKAAYRLSGLSPALVSLALSEPIEGRPFTESWILFNPDTNVAIGDPIVVRKGRLSRMTIAGPVRRREQQ